MPAYPKKGLINRIDYDPQTGCWNWIGAKDTYGYGNTVFMGRYIRAHRLAAHLWLRMPLGDKRLVLHRCDNPACFNPKHLFLGSYSDNAYDCVAKGRHKETKKTSCPHGHPYDEKNTQYFKTRRICKACKAAYKKRTKSKER